MSQSRTTSIKDVLREQFKTKECKIKNFMREKLAGYNGMASRIFDNCEQVLPSIVIRQLTNKFIKILSEVKVTERDTLNVEKLTLTNEENIKAFDKWILDIASIATREFIDENGHVKNEIINFFGWNTYKAKLGMTDTTLSILCGFISRVMQEVIMLTTSEEIAKHNNGLSYFALGNYLKNPKFNNENISTLKPRALCKQQGESNLKRLVIKALHIQGVVWVEHIEPPPKLPQRLARGRERFDSASQRVVDTISKPPYYNFFNKKREPSCIEIQELKRLNVR